jgi:hypothetical protein
MLLTKDCMNNVFRESEAQGQSEKRVYVMSSVAAARLAKMAAFAGAGL